MRKYYCDICGDEIELGDEENTEFDECNVLGSCDICKKCHEIYNALDIPAIVSAEIINQRTDIPRAAVECPHCGKVI